METGLQKLSYQGLPYGDPILSYARVYEMALEGAELKQSFLGGFAGTFFPFGLAIAGLIASKYSPLGGVLYGALSLLTFFFVWRIRHAKRTTEEQERVDDPILHHLHEVWKTSLVLKHRVARWNLYVDMRRDDAENNPNEVEEYQRLQEGTESLRLITIEVYHLIQVWKQREEEKHDGLDSSVSLDMTIARLSSAQQMLRANLEGQFELDTLLATASARHEDLLKPSSPPPQPRRRKA